MASDLLLHLLSMVRAELPQVPHETWLRIERNLRGEHGGQETYIPRRRKASLLERLEAAQQADADMTTEEIAAKLGISVRHARRIKKNG